MAEPPAEPAYDFHELADLFPLMEGPAFDVLVDDIKANGLQQPITLLDDRILDGRNCYRACKAAGIEPHFKTYEGGDPLRFIVSANLHRRHLKAGQRAMIAARLANLHNGQRADYAAASQICKPVTQAQAAELMNVSPRSVAHAKTVQERGSAELQKAVDAGEISPSRAALEITPTQKRIADRYVTKSGKLKTSDERRAEELEAKSETISDLDSDEMSTLIARQSELSAAAKAAAPRAFPAKKQLDVTSRGLAAIRATEPRKIDRDVAPEEEAARAAFYDIEEFVAQINDLDPKTVASNLNEDDEDEHRARERALSGAESCIRWFTDFAEALRQLSPAPAPAASTSAPAEAPAETTPA